MVIGLGYTVNTFASAAILIRFTKRRGCSTVLGPGAAIGPKEWILGLPRDFESNLAVLLKRGLIEARQDGFRFQARQKSYSPPS